MTAPDPDEDSAADETAATAAEKDRRREEETDDPHDEDADHLRDVPVGAGCTEIWDHLSGTREGTSGSNSDSDPDREPVDGD